MKYDLESIERRAYLISRIKVALLKLLFVVLIIMLYNVFLITKSSLSQSGAKDVFGYRAYVIVTDSMKPALNVGDVLITTKISEDKIKVGDVVTFERDGETISHRIVDIKQNGVGLQYVTKGDDNNTIDTSQITYADIDGVEVLVIPYLGSLVLLMGNRLYIVLLACLILIIFLHTRKTQSRRKMRREKKRNEDKKLQDTTSHDVDS